jgi:predicted  nucleic acid-binding Zn-ribbon protein
MCAKATASKKNEASVEDKLEALYALQRIDSQIDKINFIKGELPMEVQDMEDEMAGYVTRKTNLDGELAEVEEGISERHRIKEETKLLIQKLEKQQNSVKNNREFESISKEIELAKLEIELCDKKLKDFTEKKNSFTVRMEEVEKLIHGKKDDLAIKQEELKVIETETDSELANLMKQSEAAKELVDERLLSGYNRIRKTYRNGLAIVTIDRDSCGGCYAKIPPQRQLEIKQRKKVLVCENCGRIFVYSKERELEDLNKPVEEAPKVTRSRSKRVRQD